MYFLDTKLKVEKFIEKKKDTFFTEVQYLGNDKMQIKQPQLRYILKDLCKEGKIELINIEVGKKNFTKIKWVVKRGGSVKKKV